MAYQAQSPTRQMCRLTFALTGIVLMSYPFSSSADAIAADASGLRPSRWVFLPELTTNSEPDICEPFLAAAREAFLEPRFEVGLPDRSWPGADVHWIFSPAQNTEDRSGTIEGSNLNMLPHPADLDGDGHPEFLVFINWTHSWRGDNYALHRLPSSTDLDQLRAAPRNSGFFSEATALDSPRWSVPAVAEIDGVHYLLQRPEPWEDLPSIALYRITAAGDLPKACEVSLHSDPEQTLAGLSDTPVAGLFAFLRGIVGSSGNCGTMNTHAHVVNAGVRTGPRAALRPWALQDGEGDFYQPRAVVDSAMSTWTHQSLWNFRQFRHYPNHVAAAEVALARYYREAFGVPDPMAREEARRVLSQIIRRHFSFPSYPASPLSDIQLLALEGGPLEAIDAILAANPEALEEAGSDWDGNRLESPVFFALEHPDVLDRFLKSGAPPNAINAFGKTPLMYAAQFDLPDAARLLLQYGADPNARTTALWRCEITIEIGNRTALMYAAENASAEMIELLVQAGADIAAQDTRQRDLLDYLSRNATMTEDERRVAEQVLKLN